MFPEATRQADFVLPPLAGQISAINVTTASVSQDLSLCGNQTRDASQKQSADIGLVGLYVTFQADAGDVYYNFSAAAGTVDDTARGVNAANAGMKIPSGSAIDVKVTAATKFINFKTASGAAVLRFAPTSPRP